MGLWEWRSCLVGMWWVRLVLRRLLCISLVRVSGVRLAVWWLLSVLRLLLRIGVVLRLWLGRVRRVGGS